MKKILTILVIFCAVHSNGQDLLNSRKTSYYTYIYKIKDKEALRIYKDKDIKIEKKFLHTLIDSFPTDSEYTGKLNYGHYLKMNIEKDLLKFEITSVNPVDIKVVNNSTDLCIQVFDSVGNPVPDAKLTIGNKNLKYDRKTSAYIIRKSNRKGILKIDCRGTTSYFDLTRQYNVSGAKRFARKIVYGFPVKYVWIPVNFVIHLPIDGVKSISRRYAVGTIYSSKNFFIKLFERTACLFDDYYCDDDHFSEKYKSYLVYNKPKYMPGDTVKFKAFICNKKGKAIDKKVRVVFTNGSYKQFKLTELNPYREGAFEYQFFLHDSLGLQLDKNFDISLEKKPGKSYVSESFRYEDYELSSVKLNLRTSSKNQFKDKEFKVFISGKDENDLNLIDARVQLLLKSKKVSAAFCSELFVPDTLFYLEKSLETSYETEIIIPDSTFPFANLGYELEARLLTSDNDLQTKKMDIQYYSKFLDAELSIEKDTLLFKYFENGIEKSVQARILALDDFGNEMDLGLKTIPYKVKLNPYYSNYQLVTDSLTKTLNLSGMDSQIDCITERNKDSIHFRVVNPRNIQFSYFVYRVNKEILRGYGKSFEWHEKNNNKKNYYVMIQYLWSGQIQNKNYLLQLTENKLNIEVDEPKIVYPGQKTNIKIKVTDVNGNPVPDVDLTGFSLTKKFNYTDPEVPAFEKNRKSKSIVNSFRVKNKIIEDEITEKLNYNKWRKLTGLDSIEYYKFLYPGRIIYLYSYRPKDETAQFSPFVINNGSYQAIHVIYVDRLPVYFSWSTNVQNYSFHIGAGYHQIKLRTRYKEYIIDSLYINANQKLIFSLSDSVDNKNVKVQTLKPELSSSEKSNLYRYIMPYRNTFGNNLAYIGQDDRLIYLKPQYRANYQNLAGPVFPRAVSFNQLNAFETGFDFEPYFDYEFQNGLLKMRSFDFKKFPFLLYSQPRNSISDLVIKKQDIINEWNAYLEETRYSDIRFLNSDYSNTGKTKLIVSYPSENEKSENLPLHILVKNIESYHYNRIQTYQVYDLGFTNQKYIKLVFIYPGNQYAIYDSICIKPNGINYFEFSKPSKMIPGVFNASEDIEIHPKEYLEVKGKTKAIETEKPISYNINNKSKWRIISGKVTDDNGKSLPGVNVMVKGTQLGTISDLKGMYSIEVPDEASELVFSFIGMETKNQRIEGNFLETSLSASMCALDEVVVVGYGVTKKMDLTGSVSVVNAEYALQGKAAGVSITNTSYNPGAGESIRIRGVSELNSGSEPLYVVDGVVYTGSTLNLDPSQLTSVEVLKGEDATAIYGSRAANGVVIITTNGTVKISKNKGAVYDEEFYNASMSANSIRNNFSDYAFWQPALKTDQNGIATFNAVFPDDITGWDTHYMAMNGKRKSGQAKGFIRSYKPLMAQLSVPRFLTEGDSSNIIGKVKNYTTDSVSIVTKFEINDSLLFSDDKKCSDVALDTFMIAAGSDSLKIRYYLQKTDGYFDGEERKIPVFPIGLEETRGQFFVLDKDTTIFPVFDTTISEVNLYAKADELDIITDEIHGLIDYKYACNEQLASKLKGLLSLKYICEFKKEKFSYEKETKEIIKMLVKNRQDNGLWGWWNRNGKSYWISVHVLEALFKAKEMDYQVAVDTPSGINDLIYSLESNLSSGEMIRILYLVKQYNQSVDYQKYITKIENYPAKSLFENLSLIELKQWCGIPVKADTVFSFSKKTLFGNLYFATDEKNTCFYENEIQNTLAAYRIIRHDSTLSRDSLLKIRNFLFENRRNSGWLNTFESAKIIETILPELAVAMKELKKPVIIITGDINKKVGQFPFEIKLSAKTKISVRKSGNYPIYLTTFQKLWNPAPKSKSGDFTINTELKNNEKSNILTSGKTYKIVTYLEVKKDAEYVMVEVPVPGGCSYIEKSQGNYYEVYREYFKQKVSIFCEHLKTGKYQFEIEIIPRYTGVYTLNPAKVELMYFPTFNANNEVKKIIVK